MAELLFPAIDPVMLTIGPLNLRWYGLMFVFAFFAGQFILTRFARSGFLPMPPERVPDLIVVMVLGVLLGGRLGYCLFYQPSLLTSWRIVAVWEGGLSFHGGLIGACLAFVWFARRAGVSAWRMGDAVAMATPPGIFAVRVANFVNGELYGRKVVDQSLPWAMRFPTDPAAERLLGLHRLEGKRAQELRILNAYESGEWERIKDQVPLRHPSQIYEALGEGLLVGLVILVVYRATKGRLGTGVYGGLFLLLYGVVRFGLEFFRQPDEQFETAGKEIGTIVLGLSMGQLLCSAMIAVGLGIVLARWRKRAAPPPSPPAAGPASQANAGARRAEAAR